MKHSNASYPSFSPLIHSLLLTPSLIMWLSILLRPISRSAAPTGILYFWVNSSSLNQLFLLAGLPILVMILSIFHHLNNLKNPNRLNSINFITAFILTTFAFMAASANT